MLDVADDGLDDRCALLHHLAEHGCSVEEMRTAQRAGRLFALLSDRVLRPGGDRYSLEDTALETGLDVNAVRQLWSALGWRVGRPDERVVSDEERAIALGFPVLVSRFGLDAAVDLARTIAGAMATIAEGASALVRADPAMSVARSGSELTTAIAAGRSAAVMPWMADLLDVSYRQHVVAARGRFEASDSYDSVEQHLVEAAVGFVDITGYTAASTQLTLPELCELVRRFEVHAANAAARHDGRVVKFIGDAAMLVAPTPRRLATMAIDLVGSWDSASSGAISVRGGLAHGRVATRQGDYFGAPVNLAARLVAVAPVGALLVTAAFADEMGDLPWRQGPEERLTIRGFDEPITARTLSPIP